MHDPPLRAPENGLNLRNPAMPTDDTDPTPSSGPNSTDPIFPPKLGKAGPREVSVTAVQGPGVDAVPAAPPKESTTTEQLLSGLLDSGDSKKKDKPRKRETSGESAADYSASPRPVPVGRKEKGEAAVIVAPVSSPGAARQNAALGAALRARAAETLDEPGKPSGYKGTRDDQTVPLPRKSDRRGAFAFFAALLLVGGIGWLVLGRGGDKPVSTTPTLTTAATPTTTTASPLDTALAIPPPTAAPAPDDTNVTADPVIESQQLKRPKNVPPHASANILATAAGPTASAAPPPPPTATPTPTGTNGAPDFDELKKGIKH